MHGVLDASSKITKGKNIEISQKASERQAQNMLAAVEDNEQEYLEVMICRFVDL